VVSASSASPGTLGLVLEQHETDRQTTDVVGKRTAQPIGNAGPTALGDLIGRNPNRSQVDRLILVPSHAGASSFDDRTIFLVLAHLRFEIYSLGQQAPMTRTVTLAPEMVRVYYQDAPMNEVKGVAQRDADGHVRIPLSPPTATGPHGPEIDRVEIDLAGPLQGVDVGRENLDNAGVGATKQWKETRPDELSEGPASSSGCGVGCSGR